MALESGTYIDDLVSSNPPQSDSLTQAAGHLRLIKATLLATFPNVAGAVTGTHTQLNSATAGVARNGFVPAGAISAFGGATLPDGYLWCNGAAVSRTTYADLFTAIGTTWGTGDGSTTFNTPNLKDRFLIGKADMGSTADAAIIDSLLTTTTLGATYDGEGAIDTITLAEANVPAHTHSIPALAFSGTTGSGGSHSHTFSDTVSFNDTSWVGSISTSDSDDKRGDGGFFDFITDVNANTGTISGSVSGTTSTHSGHTHTFSGTTGTGTSGSTGSTTAFTVAILPPSAVVNYIIKT
jgi:microcystin-dependent protein